MMEEITQEDSSQLSCYLLDKTLRGKVADDLVKITVEADP